MTNVSNEYGNSAVNKSYLFKFSNFHEIKKFQKHETTENRFYFPARYVCIQSTLIQCNLIICVIRESNPSLSLGRREFYH